ncbi:MAG: MBL fold metallo-hydrolase [Bacteroidia bacterium]|nr:MBL fold metallo-hydrolase [Bacteroidia bacterium]MDW8345742.1 MBL fold metallo-hydrolase [Bacteroidia bacterium]
MKITFWGAAREITGSMHLIELSDGFKILLDCGLYQGAKEELYVRNKSFPFDPCSINVVILSHAHADHAGNIPNLVKHGFKGKIISTPATFDLCAYILTDSANLNQNDAKKRRGRNTHAPLQALYSHQDVQLSLELFHTAYYNKWYSIHPNVKFMFTDAGHILGSASITLEITENGTKTRIGFTGDIGTETRLVLRDPVPMPQVDYLIAESTYGARTHSRKETPEDALYRIFKETCLERKAKLIIPAFSLDRTQAVIFAFEKLSRAGKLAHVPVYVDSPLATDLTQNVFTKYPDCFDEEVLAYFNNNNNPFEFDKLTYILTKEESKQLNKLEGPCVIISASGMGEGGRVVHHLKNTLSKPENTILIVGFCAENTLGHKILKKDPPYIEIFGDIVPILAHTEQIDAFSAHADQSELLRFIDTQDKTLLKKVFLVHGEYQEQLAFKDLLQKYNFNNVEIPEKGQVFEINTAEYGVG